MSVDPRNRYGIRWGRDLPLEEALFLGGQILKRWFVIGTTVGVATRRDNRVVAQYLSVPIAKGHLLSK